MIDRCGLGGVWVYASLIAGQNRGTSNDHRFDVNEHEGIRNLI